MLSLRNGKTYFGIVLLSIFLDFFLIFCGSCLMIKTKFSIDIFSAFRYFFHKKVIGLINRTIHNNFRPKFASFGYRENIMLFVANIALINAITMIIGNM